MNDTPNQQVSLQERPRRQMTVIEDVIPLLDTARFSHMKNIALVMAEMSLLPDYLKGSTFEGTCANCFMIINQAVKWRMDPFAAARSMFILHGKLGYEGKLLIAALDSTLGITLDFEWSGTVGTEGHGIKITGPRPSDGKMVSISGTVGDWQTKEKNGDIKGNWRGHNQVNQLVYRGTAEWARIYTPSIIVGAYTHDELESMEEDMRGRGARVIGSSADEPAAPEADKKPRGRPRKEPEANRMQDAGGTSQTPAGDTIDNGTGEVIKEADKPADAKPADAKAGDEPAPPPAKEKPADKPAESKPATADTHGAFLEELFGRIGPDAELKNAISKLDAMFITGKSLAELKGKYDEFLKTAPKWTKTQDAFLLEFRKHHRERVESAAAAAAAGAEPAPPPADVKPTFDYTGFLHNLEVQLGAAKSADEVGTIFDMATSTALKDGAITEEQMEADVRPLSLAAMERFSFGG